MPQATPTILVADDHPLFREALKGAVAKLLPMARLVESVDAESLFTSAEAHPEADLLLLDLNMPGAHGFSALVHLRGVQPQLPIIVVSAREEPSVVRRALERLVRPLKGVIGLIDNIALKPSVAPADLSTRIQDALTRQAARDARRIEVTTEGATVNLRGRVHSWAERSAAEGAAWSAPGVSRVNNHLTIDA